MGILFRRIQIKMYGATDFAPLRTVFWALILLLCLIMWPAGVSARPDGYFKILIEAGGVGDEFPSTEVTEITGNAKASVGSNITITVTPARRLFGRCNENLAQWKLFLDLREEWTPTEPSMAKMRLVATGMIGEAKQVEFEKEGFYYLYGYEPDAPHYCRILIKLKFFARHDQPPPPAVQVRARLEDEDDQLTPADEAKLFFTIKNNSEKQITNLEVEVATAGEFAEKGVMKFLGKPAEDRFKPLQNESLGPGQMREFDVQIRTAGERNQWIFEKLIRGAQQDRKPTLEKGVPLSRVIRVKVTGSVHGEGEPRTPTSGVLFDATVPIRKGEQVHRLSYPDLTELAGMPPPRSGVNAADYGKRLAYYRRGDPKWTYPGNEIVRAVALRAARYGSSHEASFKEFLSGPDSEMEKRLIPPAEAEPDGPLFPEKDVSHVVKNVANFVHAALFPKNWPGTVYSGLGLAKRIWKGEMGPGKKSVKGTEFVCQSHHLLLGSLLRALGIPVREANMMKNIFPAIGNIVIGPVQDAASEAFYPDGDNNRGSWHFWGLYDKSKPFTDHFAHYHSWWFNYDMYVGAGPYEASLISRYNMSREKMNESPAWQYAGFATFSMVGFWPSPVPPPDQSLMGLYFPDVLGVSSVEAIGLLIDVIRSPVVAMVVMPDGRRIGASGPLDPSTFRVYQLGGSDRIPGIVNEIPGGYYYPEGLTLYKDMSDPETAFKTEQTIIVPIRDAAERTNRRIILTAIGDGPYEIRSTYVDREGNTDQFTSVKGNVTAGKRVEIPGAALVPGQPPSATAKPAEIPSKPKPLIPPTVPTVPAPPVGDLASGKPKPLETPSKPKPFQGQLPVKQWPPREVVQQFDNGSINWSTGKVIAVGIGAPPPNAVNMAQARAMARRAAIVVARRNLLELVQGVQIDSLTLVKEAVVQSDIIRTSIQGVVRNAQIVDTDYMSDGSVEVKVAMNMSGQLANTVLPQHSLAVPWATGPSVATVTPETLKPSSDIITGLVVDARGLGARPAMSPKIVDETGKEIYGSAMVNRQHAVQQGMAGYTRDLSDAQENNRVTANPLTVKGLRSVGPGKSDIVISNSDASRILSAAENLNFMQKCRVMIVLD